MKNNDETITISKKEYNQLKYDSDKLSKIKHAEKSMPLGLRSKYDNYLNYSINRR